MFDKIFLRTLPRHFNIFWSQMRPKQLKKWMKNFFMSVNQNALYFLFLDPDYQVVKNHCSLVCKYVYVGAWAGCDKACVPLLSRKCAQLLMAGWNSFLMNSTFTRNRQRDERREEKKLSSYKQKALSFFKCVLGHFTAVLQTCMPPFHPTNQQYSKSCGGKG